jgi:hypothetical protein
LWDSVTVSVRWGFSPNARQMRLTVACDRPGGRGQAPGAPGGRVRGLGLPRPGDDPLDVLVGDLARGPGPLVVGQPVAAPRDEPRPPLAHRLCGDAELGGDVLVVQAVGAGQDDPGPLGPLLGALGSARPGLQGLSLVVGEDQFGFAAASGQGGSPFEETVPPEGPGRKTYLTDF